MGGGGGSKSSSTSTTNIRYAPYVEAAHQNFLNVVASYRALAIDNSPYADYSDIEFLDGLFGSGYVLSSFPSLYDMYGKFMAGLDIEVLFTQILEDSINNTAIDNRVAAHSQELEDELEQKALPRFNAGMRDINSVMSSTFIIGRALLEAQRVKEVSKYDADLRRAMLPIAVQRFATHLDWNEKVVMDYAQLFKLYVASSIDVNKFNYDMKMKDAVWPFEVLDYERAALGALQGAMTQTTRSGGGGSQTSSAIGSALIGAGTGYAISGGNPVGALIGGAIGLATSFF